MGFQVYVWVKSRAVHCHRITAVSETVNTVAVTVPYKVSRSHLRYDYGTEHLPYRPVPSALYTAVYGLIRLTAAPVGNQPVFNTCKAETHSEHKPIGLGIPVSGQSSRIPSFSCLGILHSQTVNDEFSVVFE
jgi:hypothetical protein